MRYDGEENAHNQLLIMTRSKNMCFVEINYYFV